MLSKRRRAHVGALGQYVDGHGLREVLFQPCHDVGDLSSWRTRRREMRHVRRVWTMQQPDEEFVLDERRQVETTRNPIRASRFAMNGLTAMVAGLIAVAVGNEHAITHPYEETSLALSASAYGGPVLFLLAQAWYLRTVPRVSSRLQIVGSGALVVLGFGALAAPAYIALIGAAVGNRPEHPANSTRTFQTVLPWSLLGFDSTRSMWPRRHLERRFKANLHPLNVLA